MNLVRYILFCIFFAAGTGAIALSLEAGRVLGYYQNRDLVNRTSLANEKLKSLNDEYQAQLSYIRSEPNVLARLKGPTLGQEPSAPDTVFPKASEEELTAASKALFEDLQSKQDTAPAIPDWAKRCAKPNSRKYMFFAGAALILIAFICFGANAKPKKTKAE